MGKCLQIQRTLIYSWIHFVAVNFITNNHSYKSVENKTSGYNSKIYNFPDFPGRSKVKLYGFPEKSFKSDCFLVFPR